MNPELSIIATEIDVIMVIKWDGKRQIINVPFSNLSGVHPSIRSSEITCIPEQKDLIGLLMRKVILKAVKDMLNYCPKKKTPKKQNAPENNMHPKIALKSSYFHPKKSAHLAYCSKKPYYISIVRPQKVIYPPPPRKSFRPPESHLRPQRVHTRSGHYTLWFI